VVRCDRGQRRAAGASRDHRLGLCSGRCADRRGGRPRTRRVAARARPEVPYSPAERVRAVGGRRSPRVARRPVCHSVLLPACGRPARGRPPPRCRDDSSGDRLLRDGHHDVHREGWVVAGRHPMPRQPLRTSWPTEREWRTRSVGRPVITPGRRSSAVAATSTTPRLPPRSCVPPASSVWPSSTSMPTTEMALRRSSGTTQRCSTDRFTSTPPRVGSRTRSVTLTRSTPATHSRSLR
jgi:hypothetical protein